MKLSAKAFFILFLLLSNSSYGQIDSSFNKFDLNTTFNFDSLTISARFAECGEFGGHKENMQLHSIGDLIKCTFKVFSCNCDSVDYYMYNHAPISPISVKTKYLDQKDLNALTLYIEQLSHSWTIRQNGFHAGEEYRIVGRKSTLVIIAYGFDKEMTESYKKLLSVIFP